MSTDFEVITVCKPSKSSLKKFVKKEGELSLSGDFSCLSAESANGSTPIATIDGPFAIERDDLHESINAVLLAPKWCVQIHMPAQTTMKSAEVVVQLCRYLADNFQGIVYDPQGNKIIWPLGTPNYPAKPDKRIDIVTLDFFLPFTAVTGGTSAQFLDILREYCPEAVPTRFGAFEPLQGKLLPDSDDSFHTEWRHQLVSDFGGMFFWKAQSPCFGGHASFLGRRESPPTVPWKLQRCQRISISFDGRCCGSDRKWCVKIITLFEQIANRLKAFYAAGFIERHVIANRNSLSYDSNSESINVNRSKWWMGLPLEPTWLAWFGASYSRLLESDLKYSRYARVAESGEILLCMSDAPLNRDALQDIFPELPGDLLQRQSSGILQKGSLPVELIVENGAEELSPEEIAQRFGPEVARLLGQRRAVPYQPIPAKFIPSIDLFEQS